MDFQINPKFQLLLLHFHSELGFHYLNPSYCFILVGLVEPEPSLATMLEVVVALIINIEYLINLV